MFEARNPEASSFTRNNIAAHIINEVLLEEGLDRLSRCVHTIAKLEDPETLGIEWDKRVKDYMLECCKQRGDFPVSENFYIDIIERIVLMYGDSVKRIVASAAAKSELGMYSQQIYIRNTVYAKLGKIKPIVGALTAYVVMHSLPSLYPNNIAEELVIMLENLQKKRADS